MSITDFIKAKFAQQKVDNVVSAICPNCGAGLDFEFTHTQNTTVDSQLVRISKKGAK